MGSKFKRRKHSSFVRAKRRKSLEVQALFAKEKVKSLNVFTVKFALLLFLVARKRFCSTLPFVKLSPKQTFWRASCERALKNNNKEANCFFFLSHSHFPYNIKHMQLEMKKK